MPLKAGACAGGAAGGHKHGGLQHRQHVAVQHGAHGAVTGFVSAAAEAGIQIGLSVFGNHAGVELRLVAFLFAKARAVRIVHIAVEFIFASGFIAHRHRYNAPGAEHIVQIIPAIGSHGHVGGIQVSLQIAVAGILILAVNHALIAPVAQVIHRGRPAHIVAHAVHIAAEEVMGAVYIDPVAEHIGLAIGDILP